MVTVMLSLSRLSVLALLCLFALSPLDGAAPRAQGNSEFGHGAPASVSQIPAGRLRDKLVTLPPQAREKALRWLQDIEFSSRDLPYMAADDTGGIYFIDSYLPEPFATPEEIDPLYWRDGSGILQDVCDNADIQPNGIPALHSLDNANNVLFLDLDGGLVPAGTAWGGGPYDTYPYDTNGDDNVVTATEREQICEIWLRVAEDFAPFNIDVTTVEPASFHPTAGRLLITRDHDKNGAALPSAGAGGVAYVGPFGYSNYHTAYSPAFVYFDNLGNGHPKYVAEATSHEMGHNLGLSHDATSTQGYYAGHGTGPTSWAPIMGVGYERGMSQWSQGEYEDASQGQDDLAIIAGKTGYALDDHGDDGASSSDLADVDGEIDTWGVIEKRDDVDVFAFTTSGGQIEITAINAPDIYDSYTHDEVGNLDIRMELRDGSGGLVEVDDLNGTPDAVIQRNLAAGTYTVHISGTGDSTIYTPGFEYYSDYGSLGQYFLSGLIATAPCVSNAPSVSILPTSQLVGAGATADYTVTVTSHSTGSCGGQTVALALNDGAATGSLSPSQLTLSPGQIGQVTLSAGGADATLLVTASVGGLSGSDSVGLLVDTQPPGPIGWDGVGTSDDDSVTVAAVPASDDHGGAVEYFFTCLSGCGDSGWQAGRTHVANDLASGTTYGFRYRTRDARGNESALSPTLNVTTAGTCVYDAPTVSIVPGSQTVSVGSNAVYTVNVTGQGTGSNCPPAVHDLAASGGGASAGLGTSTLSLVQGETKSTTLTASGPAGTHVLGVTATAPGGASGSATAGLTVEAVPLMHVESLPMTLIQASGRGAIGRVTVTVVDGVGAGVSGAQVQGGWSGVVSGGESGTTNGSGVVVFDSPKASRNTTGEFIFTVTSLSAGGYDHDIGASVTSVCIERTNSSSTNWIPCTSGPQNTPPNVTISSPSDGASIDTGTSVNFAGSASDAEDGSLTNAISWSSNLQTLSGTGGSFSEILVDGVHTITATVTDNDGASDSAQVTVTVGAPPPPPPGAVGNLSGNVRQGKTRYEDAVVTFTSGSETYETTTNGNGAYSFTDVPVGVHSVSVTIAGGGCGKTSNAEVFDSQTTTLNFRLKC